MRTFTRVLLVLPVLMSSADALNVRYLEGKRVCKGVYIVLVNVDFAILRIRSFAVEGDDLTREFLEFYETGGKLFVR